MSAKEDLTWTSGSVTEYWNGLSNEDDYQIWLDNKIDLYALAQWFSFLDLLVSSHRAERVSFTSFLRYGDYSMPSKLFHIWGLGFIEKEKWMRILYLTTRFLFETITSLSWFNNNDFYSTKNLCYLFSLPFDLAHTIRNKELALIIPEIKFASFMLLWSTKSARSNVHWIAILHYSKKINKLLFVTLLQLDITTKQTVTMMYSLIKKKNQRVPKLLKKAIVLYSKRTVEFFLRLLFESRNENRKWV